MTLPTISIIIPVYNVKEFLEKCVRSAVFQTYPQLEIILVDDGSTDGSDILCDELAKKYSRIKVFHKPNGGLSSARNYGMDHMSGDYFFFLDSDDYILADTIEQMYYALKLLDVEIIECGYYKVKSDTAYSNYGSFEIRKDTIQTFVCLVSQWKDHFPMAWNKLYSTKRFGCFRFKEGRLNEDEFFLNDWFSNVEYVGLIKNAYYCYRERAGSIMARPYYLQRTDAIDAYVQRYNIAKRVLPGACEELCFMIGNQVLNKTKLVSSQGNDADFTIRKRIVALATPIIDDILNCKRFPSWDRKSLTLLKDDPEKYLKEVK